MANFLRVKNWDKFQQYKDGRPMLFIRVDVGLLDNYEFETLSTIDQLNLMKIWLLAGRCNNEIHNDENWITRKIGASKKVDIKQLVQDGWLVPYETVRDSTDLGLEKKREDKKRKEEDTVPYRDIIRTYHEALPTLPTVLENRFKGNKSYSVLKARWEEDKNHQDLDFWKEFFAVVSTNAFWLGENDRDWKADLHWLVKRDNFDKVLNRWNDLGAAA